MFAFGILVYFFYLSDVVVLTKEMNILWLLICAYFVRASSSAIFESKNVSDCFELNRNKPRSKLFNCLRFCGDDIQCNSDDNEIDRLRSYGFILKTILHTTFRQNDRDKKYIFHEVIALTNEAFVNLFEETILVSLNTEELFNNEIMKELDWYGVAKDEIISFQIRKQFKIMEFNLQAQLTNAFARVYQRVNISQFINPNEFQTHENMTNNEKLRALMVIGAILNAMHINNDLQNPLLNEIAYLIFYADKINKDQWQDEILNKYLQRFASRIPKCLAKVAFSHEMRNFTFYNEHSGPDRQYLGEFPIFYIWTVEKAASGFTILEDNDYEYISRQVYFIPSLTNPTSCYIQIVSSNEFVIQSGESMPMILWDEKYLWNPELQ